jgi:tRNA(Ile)-lysidine synthase
MNTKLQIVAKVFNSFTNNHYHPNSTKLIVACSGGKDSMALLHIVHALGYKVLAAHCNFNLRGQESISDELHVINYCKDNNIDCVVQSFSTNEFMQAHKLGVQEAARNLRYSWFDELLATQKNSILITAHHLNDDIETSLMRLFKGNGVVGIKGIPMRNGKYFRPLLNIALDEIVHYVNENNIPYVEDSSNQTDDYERNDLRHHVIPFLLDKYPNLIPSYKQSLLYLKEADHLITELLTAKRKKLIEQRNNEFYISILLLQKEVALHTVVYSLIQPFGFMSAQVQDVLNLMQAQNSKRVQSASHVIFKHHNFLIIASLSSDDATQVLIDAQDQTVVFGGKQLKITHNSNQNF